MSKLNFNKITATQILQAAKKYEEQPGLGWHALSEFLKHEFPELELAEQALVKGGGNLERAIAWIQKQKSKKS